MTTFCPDIVRNILEYSLMPETQQFLFVSKDIHHATKTFYDSFYLGSFTKKTKIMFMQTKHASIIFMSGGRLTDSRVIKYADEFLNVSDKSKFSILKFSADDEAGGKQAICFNDSQKINGVSRIVGIPDNFDDKFAGRLFGTLLHLPKFSYKTKGISKYAAYIYHYDKIGLCLLIDVNNKHSIFHVNEVTQCGDDAKLVTLRNGTKHKITYNNFCVLNDLCKDYLLIGKQTIYSVKDDSFKPVEIKKVNKMLKRKTACTIM